MIHNQISKNAISKVFQDVLLSTKLIRKSDTAAIFYDLDFLSARIKIIKEIFPDSSNHAIAVKANPLIEILKKFKEMGVGAETASLPELYMAEKVGFKPVKIVFDSPSKTLAEIEYALKLGVYINADSFHEISRIDSILKTSKSSSNIGIRINPQIGAGSIKSTSVADKISKFGIPMDTNKEEIINCYKRHPWLNGIHLHIGSQGITQDQLLVGLSKVYTLTLEINKVLAAKGRCIKFFDMGGGYPVSYKHNHEIPSLESYIARAKNNHPNLFSNKYTLITEFGRYVNANAAWSISRVEYVKEESTYKILSTHLGADFMLREAYNPDDWQHELTVLDKNGKIKIGIDTKKYIIAGPLCFAGDIIASQVSLPEVEAGDYLVIHDVGAYTLSMWSRYNSRQIPKVIGYSASKDKYTTLKHRETLEDVYDFWQK